MIRVLIADDEIHFRNYMLTAVDWSALGFQICSVAQNGQEALSAIRDSHPALAFLDINMPLMDGISLAERARALDPDLMIVFVTGYSDFAYAKKAIQLHIEDYLLKPFSPEELTRLLLLLNQKYDLIRSQNSRDRQARRVIMDRFLNSLLSFSPEDSRLWENRRNIPENWKISDCFTIAVIELSYLNCVELSRKDLPLWKFSVVNCMNEVLPETEKYYSFYGPCDRIIYLFNFRNQNSHSSYSFSFMQKAAEFIHSCFPITLSIGIGNPVSGVDAISTSYKNALLALQNHDPRNGILHYFTENTPDLSKGFYSLDIYNRLMFALRQNSLPEVTDILENVEREIFEKKYDTDSIQTMFTSIFSICLSFISEKKGNIMDVLDNDLSWYQNCFATARIHDSCLFLSRLYEKTMQMYSAARSSHSMEIILRVQNYIRSHYMDEDLSVEQISDYMILDASYIRKLFSKYMKCTITDFLVATRMEQARKLLEQGETNITSVSALVGYKDSGYFSKVFKKYYGTAPKGYIAGAHRTSSM